MQTATQSPPSSSGSTTRAGRWGLVALVLVGVLLLIRGYLITHEQTLRFDDNHLWVGLRYWHRAIPQSLWVGDPPLGSALSAVPLLLFPELRNAPETTAEPFMNRLTQVHLEWVGIWKSLLFLPLVGLVFIWVRRIYSPAAGWLAATMLLIDPTFAAHIPIGAVDVLGVEVIAIACFFGWRFCQNPTWGRLLPAVLACAGAVMTKHTAILLPGIVGAYALLWWVVRPWQRGELKISWKGTLGSRVGMIGAGIGMGLVLMWAFTLFDVRPARLPVGWGRVEWQPPWVQTLATTPLPGGMYVTAFMSGMDHSERGHPAFVYGQYGSMGWWYYFPVLATLKIPVGLWIVLILGLLSLMVVRPRFEEWSIFIPAVAWGVLMMRSNINIGFRHFLPAYLFLILLASRCVLAGGWWRGAAWTGVIVAAAHGLSYHPDYLSYVNRPIDKPYLLMSDSNIDWGQAARQVGTWIERNAPPNRTVTVIHFGYVRQEWVGTRARIVSYNARELPASGLLIISPMWVTGQLDPDRRFVGLMDKDPIATIGHCMLVFDLDKLGGGQPMRWPPGGRAFELKP